MSSSASTSPNSVFLYLYVLIFPNGKRYAGISNDWRKRWSRFGMKGNKKGTTPVQCAILHFGYKNVKKVPIAFGSREYILEMEQRAIAEWKLTNRRFGYNCSLGGESAPMHSPASVEKMRKTLTGRTLSDKELAAMRSNFDKARAARTFSDDWRQKLRDAKKRPGYYCAGATGTTWTEAQRIAHSSAECCEAISRGLTGKKFTDERRSNMCIAQQRRRQRERAAAE